MGRTLLSTAAFAAAFALVCIVNWLPPILENVPGSGPKYAYYRDHHEQFDTIFVGSSRVFHHFIPADFETGVAQHSGQRVRAFNLGYDGVWPPESFYLLRQVLKLRPPNLRWVLIDLMRIDPKIEETNNTTLRIVYWHDLKHTLLALRALSNEQRLKPGRKFSLAVAHLGHFLHRAVDLGRGSELLQQKLKNAEPKVSVPKWIARNGFEVGSDQPMEGKKLAEYERLLGIFRRNTRSGVLTPEFRQAIVEISREVRAAGAEPVFVLAPSLAWWERVSEFPEGIRLISFADPDKYPALYDPANHYDAWHLNEAGAIVFTDLLARELSEVLKASGTGTGPGAGTHE